MKTILAHLFLVFSLHSIGQETDFCNYFDMKFSSYEYEGKEYLSCAPEVLKYPKDAKCVFFKEHQMRYDYIFFKFIDRTKGMSAFYPDTNRIHQEFCENVVSTADIKNYFTNLTPEKYVKWLSPKDTFTVDELMLIASRFFYCDYIDEADTTISSHVCVGINGLKDFDHKRDYTILEAFTVEGIMSYLQEDEPQFYLEFYNYFNKIGKEKRHEFTNFEAYLVQIRQLTFEYMMNNEDLKKKLMKYYGKNKTTINFVII